MMKKRNLEKSLKFNTLIIGKVYHITNSIITQHCEGGLPILNFINLVLLAVKLRVNNIRKVNRKMLKVFKNLIWAVCKLIYSVKRKMSEEMLSESRDLRPVRPGPYPGI